MTPRESAQTRAIAPKPETDGSLAARRAPTLLTAASGGRGEVRVWAPDANRLRRWIVLSAAVLFPLGAVMAVLIWMLENWYGGIHFPIWAEALFVPVPTLLMFSEAYLRRRYVTTDGEGLALITRRGSKSLRWQEIIEADFSVSGDVTLRPASGRRVVLRWLGYQPEDKAQLRELIIERAQLIGADRTGIYRRSAVELAPVSQPSRELMGGGGSPT